MQMSTMYLDKIKQTTTTIVKSLIVLRDYLQRSIRWRNAIHSIHADETRWQHCDAQTRFHSKIDINSIGYANSADLLKWIIVNWQLIPINWNEFQFQSTFLLSESYLLVIVRKWGNIGMSNDMLWCTYTRRCMSYHHSLN